MPNSEEREYALGIKGMSARITQLDTEDAFVQDLLEAMSKPITDDQPTAYMCGFRLKEDDDVPES